MQDKADSAAQAASEPGQHAPSSLREAAADVLQATRRELGELLELFTLEVRYSGLMLVSAAALAVLAVLALFSLWGLLVAALVAWLLTTALSLATALVVAALLNGGVLVIALWLIRGSLSRVGIDSTRRALKLEASDVSA